MRHPSVLVSVGIARRVIEVRFLLLGPPDRQDHHLQVLARLSRVARREGMLEALREAATPEAILDLIREQGRLLAPLG